MIVSDASIDALPPVSRRGRFRKIDAFVAYRREVGPTRVTAQLNIRNITDKEYFESTVPFSNLNLRLSLSPGAPLTAIGTLRVEF